MRSFFGRLATLPAEAITNNETKLINYIKTHSKEIVKTNMKIEKLAQEVGTGYSAIYALLKKLRFHGYKDFSLALVCNWENVLLSPMRKIKTQKWSWFQGNRWTKKSNVKIDVIHYLFVDTEMERGLEANFSKSVPFHYFIDLLIYHYNNKYVK
jgi:hypothetical protein